MSPEDRDLLQELRRRQTELQNSLTQIEQQLAGVEARSSAPHDLPPIPAHLPPTPPPFASVHDLPPVPPPVIHDLPPAPLTPYSAQPAPASAVRPARSFEFHFGRWLIGLAAVFGVITLALIFSWAHHGIYRVLGPTGIVLLSTLASLTLVLTGQRLARGRGSMPFIGNSLTAMALAWLYLTAYAACYYEPLQIIHSPFLALVLLLAWSGYVFALAERKRSQLICILAISLAYFSTAFNPIGRFTMTADLLLAATAVIFMIRNGWAATTFLSLFVTYAALLRRLILDENGELVLDTSRTLNFAPHAAYLIGAWLLFTAAVIFTSTPSFRREYRLLFLTLNNSALTALLLLTTYIAGYGHSALGWVLLDTGIVFLVISRIAGFTRVEPERVMAAYAAQGLGVFTFGLIVLFTGVTRGLLLMLETLILGAAAAFSGDRVLRIASYAAAFFATIFLIWEMSFNGHHPWLLGFSGALVLFINAWWARGDVRNGPHSRATIALGTSCLCVLALGLIFTALVTDLSFAALPPALALTALVLTFSIYFVAIYELPPLAQLFLVIAQYLVLFPSDNGEALPWWSTACVAAVTLLLLTWWSRQTITRSGTWVPLLDFVYAFALFGLAYQTVRPHVDTQDWLVCASLLSIAFLIWGACTRVWAIATVGQFFLAISVWHFFTADDFPYAWWAAAIPIAVVFATARAAHHWLDDAVEIDSLRHQLVRGLAYSYQLLAAFMLIRWTLAVVQPIHQVPALLFLGTLLFSWNSRRDAPFGVRCGYVFTLAGLAVYLDHIDTDARAEANLLTGLAFLCFLAQPLLGRAHRAIGPRETWGLTLIAAFSGWLFVSESVIARAGDDYLTMGWALYALFLYFTGRATGERHFTWCGYGFLILAILRVACVDFWGLSTGYKVITFLVLTLIASIVGFLNLRAASHKKQPPLPPVPPADPPVFPPVPPPFQG